MSNVVAEIKVDFKYAKSFLSKEKWDKKMQLAKECYEKLINRTGAGSEFTGWLDLPIKFNIIEFERIKVLAAEIRRKFDVLIVLGIGGSYLGSRFVIEACGEAFKNKKGIEVIFAGQNLSTAYLNSLKAYLSGKDFAINVISKSGKTMETAFAFRFFKELLEAKYKTKAAIRKRIFVTTDESKGPLKKNATKNKYETFVVPDDVGGRNSVLTAVGLLPLAVAGVNIDEMMRGAKDAREKYMTPTSDCIQYAAMRNVLHEDGKDIEIMAVYDPRLLFASEWWKQLYGESEGKDNKGLFPASVGYTTDLHSVGQLIQQGKRNMFETVVLVKKSENDIFIKTQEDDFDGLNALAGKTLSELNWTAAYATVLAHVDGGVPNIVITIPELTEYWLAYIIYFFELACAISAYILGVNPSDQPGVEGYKINVKAMSGYCEFEELGKTLWARIQE